MTAQELIGRIESIPYEGEKFVAARDKFINLFPLTTLPNLTLEQYQQIISAFFYKEEKEEYTDLSSTSDANAESDAVLSIDYSKLKNLAKLLGPVSLGDYKWLWESNNLKGVYRDAILKILSIYYPDKFIGVSDEYVLNLLARILEIDPIPEDVIKLNYECTAALIRLNPAYAGYEFYRLGNAICELLWPYNRKGFHESLKGNKAPKSGIPDAYVKCMQILSYFYCTNYFHTSVPIKDLEILLDNVFAFQKENGGKYYYDKPSYGEKNFYSGAVNDYIRYVRNGEVFSSNPDTESDQQSVNMKKTDRKNIILYGPPGTGKTYNTIRYAVSIIEGLDVAQFESSDLYTDLSGKKIKVQDAFNNYIDSKRICFTTFHQSLAYEDFIEGIKPISNGGNISYVVKPGIFKQICHRASKDSKRNYVLIIDEINRGNVASIFGELITLIEDDKRKGQENWVRCKLPYSNEEFSVPSNLYIIGTMNTADRSIEALDSALRRRFDFIEMMPKSHKVATVAQPYFETINKRLRILKDSEHQLGHSYFMKVSSESELCDVFRNRVIPLIQEYFFGDMDRIRMVLGGAFCVKEKVETNLFSKEDTDIDIPDVVWRLWGDADWKECASNPDKFQKELNKLES